MLRSTGSVRSWIVCALGASLLVCELSFGVTSAAQQVVDRGLSRVAVPIGPGGALQDLYSGSYAIVVGVHHYDEKAVWAQLDSVPQEMQTVITALRQVGFESVEYVDNPSSQELRRSIEAFIGAHGYVRRNRLVFFFAGHGYTMDDGERGYFVPRDAPDPSKDEAGFRRLALPMNQVATWADNITALHALFVFDSCFSGTIFRTRGDTTPQQLTAASAKPVREFLSSGSAGELVPATSVFVPLFVKGLAGDADLDRDGFVTGTELGNFLQREVLERRTKQTPQFGKVRTLKLDEGDIIFATLHSGRSGSTRAQSDVLSPVRVAATPTELPITSLSASPDGKFVAYVDPRGIHLLGPEGNAKLAPHTNGVRSVGWSRDSSQVIALDFDKKEPHLSAISVAGERHEITTEEGPNYSPDGTMRLEFIDNSTHERSRSIFARIENLHDHTTTKLFDVNWRFISMTWSPESSYLVAAASAEGGVDVFTVEPHSGHTHPITTIPEAGGNGTTNAPGVFVPNTIVALTGGRILYAAPEPHPNELDENLWLARVDAATGRSVAEPKRLTSWAGFRISAITAGHEGGQVFILTSNTQSDVAVGRVVDSGARLEDVRRLTLDNSNDVPYAWTLDSRRVVFVSDRNGTDDIFSQALDEESPEELVTGPDHETLPRMSPDGKYLLYQVAYDLGWKLMRATPTGGDRRMLMDSRAIVGFDGSVLGGIFHSCGTQGGGCFLREFEGSQFNLKISEIDEERGRKRELFKVKVPHQVNVAMSPDGSQFAVPLVDEGPPWRVRSIAVWSRGGELLREVPLPADMVVTSLEWNQSQSGFFVGVTTKWDDGYYGSELGFLSMSGEWHVLRQRTLWGLPSPDGQWLALHIPNIESAVWKVALSPIQ